MRVRLDPRTTLAQGGRLLVGGSPLTVMRLKRPVTETDSAGTLGRRWLATGLGLPVLDDVAPVAPEDLTVVVPVRGRAAELARCRASLAPLRVVVVDDASDVPVAGATVRLAAHSGPAAARNAGLREVRTPYVAFVDSDVEVSGADLLLLARHLADPTVVLVGPRVQGRAEGRRWWERYDAAFSSLDLGASPGVVRPGAAVSYLPSACLVARTDALGSGFDAALHVGEDVDLVWRLAGIATVRYEPAVVAQHDVRSTARGWLGRKVVYGTSAAVLAERHGEAIAPAVLAPTYAVAAAALLVRHRWSGALAAAAVGHAAWRLRSTVPAPVAARLGTLGLGWAVRQEAALLLRHWWPATVVVAVVSPTLRRAVVSALMVDAVVGLRDRRGVPVPALLAGRRLDDLAYGAGVWAGAVRRRSFRALAPRIARRMPARHDAGT